MFNRFLTIFSNLNYTYIAVISAFFAAVTNIAARALLKEAKSYNIMGLSFLMIGSFMLIFSPIFYFFKPTWAAIGLLYLIGIIDATANYFYFKSFEKTEASVATSLLALAPMITFIGSFIFLGTNTSLLKLILSLCIMLGIIFLSIDLKEIKKSFHSSLFAPLMACLLFGLSSIPSKYLLSNLNAINAPTLYMFRATIIGMISFIFMRPNLQSLTTQLYKLIWFQGFLAIIQWVLLYMALSKGNPGITMTLANISPVFTVFLGYLFLKERITKRKIASAILIFTFSILIIFL
jgi:drug/metabolite transporter (DMT)-like permease